jgi:hypothetical protein
MKRILIAFIAACALLIALDWACRVRAHVAYGKYVERIPDLLGICLGGAAGLGLALTLLKW